MVDKPDKWYNSKMAEYAGIGVLLVGLGVGAGYFFKGCVEMHPGSR